MKQVVVAVAVVVVLGAGAAAAPRKEAKTDPPKIVGAWEVVKSHSDIPKGTAVTFDKDGRLKVSIDFNGKKIDVEGTYKVEGDKLVVTVKGPDGKDETDTDTIKSLDDKKLVIIDKDGKEAELERK
jgi:uncharacterized protein (TIGR03066 family)